MAVPTTIMSSRPSAAILIISPSSMSGPCGLLTQGPPIAHLSRDAEPKIGSHVAEPSHTSPRCPDRASCGSCRLGARRDWPSVRGCGYGRRACLPGGAPRKVRQLAELIAYTGLASEPRHWSPLGGDQRRGGPVRDPVKRGCCGQSVTGRPTATSHRMGPGDPRAVTLRR